MKTLNTIALLLLPLSFSTLSFANVELDGNINYSFNDNISNAVNSGDIFEDQFIAANFNIGKLWLPAVGKSIVLGGHLGTEQYDDSDGLSRYSYGASLTYTQRLGLGAYAPRYSIGFVADKRDYETDMRDGWLYRASVSLEKRFLPEFIGKISLTKERRTADVNKAVAYYALAPGDVFNQDNNELTAKLDYTLENNSVFSVQYLYRNGEIDASTNPASEFFFFSKAIAQDYELCSSCGNYVAYLVDAKIHSITLDWNWALGQDTSLSANYERRIADTNGGVTYTGNIYRIQLNKRF